MRTCSERPELIDLRKRGGQVFVRDAHRPRRRRHGEHGQALIFVAIGMVAMIVMVGVAIDGGKEAGNYRFAQNAADAAALAGATRIYESLGAATKPQLCDMSTGVAPVVVSKNPPATTTACHPMTTTAYVAAGPDGLTGTGSLLSLDANVNDAGVACAHGHLRVNDASANTVDSPTPQTANGGVDLASLAASAGPVGSCSTLLGLPAKVLDCSSAVSGTGPVSQTGPSTGDPCDPNTSLGLALLGGLVDVNAVMGIPTAINHTVLIQQTTSSVPGSSRPAQSTSSNQVLGATGISFLGIGSINVNAGTSAVQAGTPTGQPGVTAQVNLTDLAGTILGQSLAVSGADMQVSATYVPGVGLVPKATCAVASINVGGLIGSIDSGCNVTPISIPGVLAVGSTISAPPCTTEDGLVSCDVKVCLLHVTILQAVANVSNVDLCLGSAEAKGTFKPITQTAAVEVVDTVATPTYFLKVIGITQSNPVTTAAAMPEQVVDESSGNFSNAPFAVQYMSTPRSDPSLPVPAFCSTVVGVLQPVIPGCDYQIYTTSFGSVDPNLGANLAVCGNASTNCWNGALSAASQHRAGQNVTFTGPLPSLNANYGSNYALLPIVDNGAGGTSAKQAVREYGLFQVNVAHGTGRLLQTPDPLNSVVTTPVESDSTTVWAPGWLGAVAVKLVDPAYLKNTLGFVET